MRGQTLEGLWVLLVDEDGRKIPMMARAGNGGVFLLAFRTGYTARKFMTDSGMEENRAEARMVVGTFANQVNEALSGKDVQGVLIDYDASTNTYKEAQGSL